MDSMTQWVIYIGGYGAFMFEGSEQAAEEMRAHKARWERGVGKKRLADPIEIETGIPSQCLNHPGYRSQSVYVDCSCPDMDCVINAQERLTP